MHLSKIKVENFRNFSNLEIRLAGNVVVVGENRVGKSNLLYALRLIFDPTLPDSARQLGLSDFWDGLERSAQDKITVSVEIEDFDEDMDVLAILTDFRLNADPNTVRLTYEFRAVAGVEEPSSPSDYEFVCYGGEDESKEFGHKLRQRITMDLLPALRDAEGDLAAWRRSPLRPLLEKAFSAIDETDLAEIGEAIELATSRVTEFEAVSELEENIGNHFREMSGPRQDIKPRLGFSPTDTSRLHRSIRLLIDDGVRGISDASLGSANIVFLSLKTLEIESLVEDNKRDHILLAIEEPEAHLHPHLQRSVYRRLFERATDEQEDALSVFLTTHSPHIASVAPIRSLVLLKETLENGTIGRSTASIQFDEGEEDDLARYLDVTRAELLFSRGVILVEGDAERFLLPTFAGKLGIPLDHLGISICSVAGTNFLPYVRFLAALDIPFSVITDWDPREDDKTPLGFNRALKLAGAIHTSKTGLPSTALRAELKSLGDYNVFSDRCDALGVFTNVHTLEIDLFTGHFQEPIFDTLREGGVGAERTGWIDGWEADPSTLDNVKYLSLIDSIGKGRFAQRLASRISELDPPDYIARAIKFVADRV